MTVESISLTNFRAHERLTIDDLESLSVFVGRNNSGKSSILYAAALPKYGFSKSREMPIGDAIDLCPPGSRPTEVEVKFRGIDSPWTSHTEPGGHTTIGWVDRRNDGLRANTINSLYYISALRGLDLSFQYDLFSPYVGLRGEDSCNIIHYLKTVDDPRLVEIINVLRDLGMGVTGLSLPTIRPGYGELRPVVYGRAHNIAFHGAGLSSVLPIVVQGALCGKGDTLLIEEPELNLHRAAIDGLWRYFGTLSDRGVQVIATTHAIDFLASMSYGIEHHWLNSTPGMYHTMRDENGRTSVVKRDPTIFRNIKTVIKTDLAAHSMD